MELPEGYTTSVDLVHPVAKLNVTLDGSKQGALRRYQELLKSHVHLAQYIDGVHTSMQYLQTTCSVDLVIVLFRVDNTCHRSCDLVTCHTLCCI